MNRLEQGMQGLLWIIAIILIFAALSAARVIIMPLAVALLVVALAWPLQQRLERKLRPSLCYVITLLVILAVFALFLGALVLCAEVIAAKMPKYEQRFLDLVQESLDWAQRHGFTIRPDEIEPSQIVQQVANALGILAIGIYESLGLFALTIVFVILILLEVHTFRDKLENRIGTVGARKLLHASRDVARSLQRFILTRTFTSALTGLLSGLYTWAIGLDFALVWGISAFLLNYVPILGSIIAVIPPTLLALILPQAVWLVPATLGGLTFIQFTIGNYLDPQLQGRFLAMSPLVVLFSMVFWGWLWGAPGAVLGVPIAVGVVIVCRHFDSTRWIADLLAGRQ